MGGGGDVFSYGNSLEKQDAFQTYDFQRYLKGTLQKDVK